MGEEDRALGAVARWAFRRAERAGKTNCRLVSGAGGVGGRKSIGGVEERLAWRCKLEGRVEA